MFTIFLRKKKKNFDFLLNMKYHKLSLQMYFFAHFNFNYKNKNNLFALKYLKYHLLR